MITGTLMSSANWITRPKLNNEGEFLFILKIVGCIQDEKITS